MAIIEGLLGLLAAFALHSLFRGLRRRWPTPVAIVGWVVVVVTVVYCVLLAMSYWSMRGDPTADLGPLWGILALMLFVLLLICAGLGFIHRRRYKITWPQAFGIIMAEAGVAVAAGFVFNEFLYPIADFIRGGNEDTDRILASYTQVRVMLGFFDWVLFVSLLLLSAFAGRRAGSVPISDKPAA